MLNKKFIFVISLLFSISFSSAQILSKKDGKYFLNQEDISLFQFVRDFSKISGINLIIVAHLKDKMIKVVGGKEFEKNELEKYLSFHLFVNGMALIKNNQEGYYELINARNIRYQNLTVYEDKNKIPDDYSYVKFIYKTKHIEEAVKLKRLFTPLLSRYGRVIDVKPAKQMIISDVAKNVKRMIQIFERIDLPETAETQKELKEFNKKFKEMSSYRGDIWQNIDKYQVYFIVLFSLISLVIGFILRGYLIRKIEGGL